VRRPYVQIGESKYLLSTLADLSFVLRIFSGIRETTELGLPEKVVRFYHEVVEDLKQFDVAEATTKWNALHKLDKKSTWCIRKWLDELERADLVSSQQDPQDRRRILYTAISRNSPEIPGNNWNTRIFGLFGYDSLENWLKNIGKEVGSYIIHNNPLTKDKIDGAKLFRLLTKGVYVNRNYFSNIFWPNSEDIWPK
jgi:hypothetical protein